MAAAALDPAPYGRDAGHDRSGGHADLPRGEGRVPVKADDRVSGAVSRTPLANTEQARGIDLLGRLEEAHHRDFRCGLGQQDGGASENGRLSIVAAGMAGAGDLRRIGRPGSIRDRQGIEAGPQGHPRSFTQGRNEAGGIGLLEAHRCAVPLDACPDPAAGLDFLETELGPLVETTAQLDELRLEPTGAPADPGRCPCAASLSPVAP